MVAIGTDSKGGMDHIESARTPVTPVGIVGAGVIISWGIGLIRSSGAVLLDVVPSHGLADRVRALLEVDDDRVADLHLWQLGPGHAGVIASVVSEHPQTPQTYKARLAGIAGLSHVTIEVHACPDHGRARAEAAP